MNFNAKLNGPPPPTQDQDILFSDCDTGLATTDTPTIILATPTHPWITATVLSATKVRVGVNQSGIAVGAYSGTVNVTIPDAETCEVGKILPIAITMNVKRGNVKFR